MGIVVKGLKKRLGGVEIYKDLSLAAKTGRITTIFGPNGSGKSTLFNILAGVMRQDSGTCSIEPFDRRGFSYMFQNYREALLPWRSNLRNIALPLEAQRLPKAKIRERIDALGKALGTRIPLDDYPYELSGGQQQMLALSRALATRPSTVLLDEPFSALDYENALRLYEALQRYHMAHKPTMLLITHSIDEAVYLAEDIIVLSSKPARVVGIVHNPMPYPRTIESISTEPFQKVKGSVLRLFRDGARL